jgi:hypothetical protein
VSNRKVRGPVPIATQLSPRLATAIVFETFKTLIRGRFPEAYYELLNAEGIELLEEDVKVTITYRRYRSPTRYSSYRKTTIKGAIAITERRVAVWGGPGKQIDVPFADPKFQKLQIDARPDGLHIAFDANDLDEKSSGSVEMKIRSAEPARLAQALSAGTIR